MSTDTDALLEQASQGDRQATDALLSRYRGRLGRMIGVYLDPRVRRRVDPSDVVQETLTLAHHRLRSYLATRPIAVYPWLRQLAVEQLDKAHRRHLRAQRRSVAREEPGSPPISGQSVLELAERLIASGTSASRNMERQDLRRQTHEALGQLSDRDKEVLVLRYLEQLSMRDIAQITGATEAAVKMRHLRALERLRTLLKEV